MWRSIYWHIGINYTHTIYLLNRTQNSDMPTKTMWYSNWSTGVEDNSICFICVCLYVCIFVLVVKLSFICVLQDQGNRFICGLGWRHNTINCCSAAAVTCTLLRSLMGPNPFYIIYCFHCLFWNFTYFIQTFVFVWKLHMYWLFW